MATFYVLPPRPMVLDRWLAVRQSLFPGAPVPISHEFEPIEALLREVEQTPGIFVVFRDDLPEGGDILESLRDSYGAEAGDQVVRVRWAVPEDPVRSEVRSVPREWSLGPAAALI